MLQLSCFHRTIRIHDIHVVLNNDCFQIVELCIVFVFRSTNQDRSLDLQEKRPILIICAPFIIRNVDCRAVSVRCLHFIPSTQSHLGIEQGQTDNDLLYVLHVGRK